MWTLFGASVRFSDASIFAPFGWAPRMPLWAPMETERKNEQHLLFVWAEQDQTLKAKNKAQKDGESGKTAPQKKSPEPARTAEPPRCHHGLRNGRRRRPAVFAYGQFAQRDTRAHFLSIALSRPNPVRVACVSSMAQRGVWSEWYRARLVSRRRRSLAIPSIGRKEWTHRMRGTHVHQIGTIRWMV